MINQISKASNQELAETIWYYNKRKLRDKDYTDTAELCAETLCSRKRNPRIVKQIIDAFLEDGINSPTALHFYIRFVLGYSIPRKQICKKHTTPFNFMSDMFFEKTRNGIAFANRTGGKCFVAGQDLHLAGGGAVLLEEYNSKQGRILSLDCDNNKIIKADAKSAQYMGKKECVKIVTDTGRELEVSYDHTPWCFFNKWKMAEDIIIGDCVAACIYGSDDIIWDKVVSVENTGLKDVYNVEVPGSHVLIVNGIVSHNTVDIAILNHLDMAFKPGCEIVSAGSIQEQAERCYQYFIGMHNENEFLQDFFLKDPTKRKSWYDNRSILEIITGSMKGLNGPHPPKVRLDEVDLMEWEVLQQGLSIAKSKTIVGGKEIIAQNTASSTRKFLTGSMQKLLDQAKKQGKYGFVVYEWCIWEILEKCTRKCKEDPVHGDCRIFEYCRGKIAPKCDGFYKINDFIDVTTRLSKDTLDIEWFNKRPATTALVYGEYWDRVRHCIDRKDFSGRQLVHIGAIDFGSSPGHPFVFQLYIVDVTDFKEALIDSMPEDIDLIKEKMKFYLSYEYRSGASTLQEHVVKIKNAPGYSSGIPIFADPSEKQARIDLEEIYGVGTIPAINAIDSGIEMLRSHLQFIGREASYYIFKDYFDCDNIELIGTDREFEVYKYPRGKDGKPVRKKPVQIDDHGMDAARYAVATAIAYFAGALLPEEEYIEQDGFWFEE